MASILPDSSIEKCFHEFRAQRVKPAMNNPKSLIVRTFFVMCCGVNNSRKLRTIRALWKELKTYSQFIRFVNSEYLSNAIYTVLPVPPRDDTIIDFLKAFLDVVKEVHGANTETTLNENLQKLLGNTMPRVRFDFPIPTVSRVINKSFKAMATRDETYVFLTTQSVLAGAATLVALGVGFASWPSIRESTMDSRNMTVLLLAAARSGYFEFDRTRSIPTRRGQWDAIFQQISINMSVLSFYMLLLAQDAPWGRTVSNQQEIVERIAAALKNKDIPDGSSTISFILNSVLKHFVPLITSIYLMFFRNLSWDDIRVTKKGMLGISAMLLVSFGTTMREWALNPGDLSTVSTVWHSKASGMLTKYYKINNTQMSAQYAKLGQGLSFNGIEILKSDTVIPNEELTTLRIAERDIGISCALLLGLLANFNEAEILFAPAFDIYPKKSEAAAKDVWPQYHRSMDKISGYNLNGLFQFLDTNYLMNQIETIWEHPFMQIELTGQEWTVQEQWGFRNHLQLLRPTITGVVDFMTDHHVTPNALRRIKPNYNPFADKSLSGKYFVQLILPEVLKEADRFLFSVIQEISFNRARNTDRRKYSLAMHGDHFFEGYNPFDHTVNNTLFLERVTKLAAAHTHRDTSRLSNAWEQIKKDGIKPFIHGQKSLMRHIDPSDENSGDDVW